ncbi:MAG: hypothetical protein ACKVS6_05330 [Planctomycetota bacterium]
MLTLRPLFCLLFVVIGIVAIPRAGAAVMQEKVNTGCQRCKFTGTLPCPKHTKAAIKMEAESIFCSIAARCEQCKGLFKIDCKDCKDNDGEASLETQAADAQRWIEKQQVFEKNMGGLARGRVITKRFDMTFEVEHLTIGMRQVEQHELLHLYASRMESLLADFNDVLGTKDFDHKCQRYLVMVWKNFLDNKEAAGRYADSGGAGSGVKLLGHRGVYTTWRDKGTMPQDDDLHRNLVHNVTHLLLADLFDGIWIGNRKAGWLDEGLAHWFEEKYFGICTNFCYQEQNTNFDFKGGKWKQPVRTLAENGKMPPFSETGDKMSDQLTTQEHALAFSYVDFLIARDAKLIPKMVQLYQKKKATREALEPFGLSMLEFEKEWKKWVLATYSKR